MTTRFLITRVGSVRPQRPIWWFAFDSDSSTPNSLGVHNHFYFRFNGLSMQFSRTLFSLILLFCQALFLRHCLGYLGLGQRGALEEYLAHKHCDQNQHDKSDQAYRVWQAHSNQQ